jgi:hypothetical protein
MKRLNVMTKELRFIFLLVAVSLIFSPFVQAETDSATSEADSQPAVQESADTPITEDEPTTEALGAAEVAAMGASDPPPPISPSAIGGAFSSLMSESFKTDLATGAATLNIPIVVPPGRKNVQPNIALSYSSNNSNGICGMGWSLPVSAIQRSTKEGVPRYGEMKDFIAGGEELINIGGNEYRAKIESSFTRYVYVTADNKWIAYDKSGTQYHFGSTQASRMTHPTNENYIFAWYIDEVVDVYGNTMGYEYWKDGNDYVYLKDIYYTSNDRCTPSLNADKRVQFVYDETTERPDKIYNNRPGWSTVIKRRLDKINVYLDLDIVWIYDLTYWPYSESSTSRSLLKSIQLSAPGEIEPLPAKTFTYQKLEP